jgi:hypothetical protein
VSAALSTRAADARETISIADRALEQRVQTAAAEYLNMVRKVGMDAALHVEATLERVGFQKILGKLATVSATAPVVQSRASYAHQKDNRPPDRLSSNASVPAVSVKRVGDGPGDASIGNSGLRRILIALAQRSGLNRRQLGLRACLSSRSGTFDTYLSKGRSNGWIEGSAQLQITAAGRAALGEYIPLPEGQALLAYWLNELGNSGAARILRALADAYPRALTRAELGAAANLSDRSGTFDTYLSKLRTLELVEGRGELRASEELFS